MRKELQISQVCPKIDWTGLHGSMSLSLEKFECFVEYFRRDSDIGYLVEQDASRNLLLVDTNTNNNNKN